MRVRLLRVVTTAGLVGTLAGIGIAGWAVVRSQAGCVGALLTAGGFVSSLYGFSCAYRSLARKRPTRVVGRGLALTMTSLDLAGRFCSAH